MCQREGENKIIRYILDIKTIVNVTLETENMILIALSNLPDKIRISIILQLFVSQDVVSIQS